MSLRQQKGNLTLCSSFDTKRSVTFDLKVRKIQGFHFWIALDLLVLINVRLALRNHFEMFAKK